MLVLHCFAAILMEVKNGGRDEVLRLRTKEENQEKESLGTAWRQKCTAGRPDARSGTLAVTPGGFAVRGKPPGGGPLTPGGFAAMRQTAKRHKRDVGRLPVGLGPVFCCALQL